VVLEAVQDVAISEIVMMLMAMTRICFIFSVFGQDIFVVQEKLQGTA
jgi:hypothetical protein